MTSKNTASKNASDSLAAEEQIRLMRLDPDFIEESAAFCACAKDCGTSCIEPAAITTPLALATGPPFVPFHVSDGSHHANAASAAMIRAIGRPALLDFTSRFYGKAFRDAQVL